LTISALPACFGFLRSPLPPDLKVQAEIAFRAGTGGLHSAENWQFET